MKSLVGQFLFGEKSTKLYELIETSIFTIIRQYNWLVPHTGRVLDVGFCFFCHRLLTLTDTGQWTMVEETNAALGSIRV